MTLRGWETRKIRFNAIKLHLSALLLISLIDCNVTKEMFLPRIILANRFMAGISGSIPAPSFSPGPGTYSAPQTVSISSSNTEAILCYTTDETDPACDSAPKCPNGNLYSAPVFVTATVTLKAIACTSVSHSGLGTGAYLISPVSLPLISNLRDKGIVNTGFIIGTAGTDAVSVEVSLDNGSYNPAVGTVSWKFQFPTGSATWKEGSKHTISVRAKNSSGEVSSIITITVRKGVNKDINGDGYEDLYVDGVGYNSGQGRIYIFYSSGSGGIAQTSAGTADRIITGENAGDQFGMGWAFGDINGDGYADLIVGASGYSGAQGRAYVFYSTGIGGIITASAGSADRIITGEAGICRFGMAAAAADINGDGYDDAVFGARGYNANWGRVYIYYSIGSGGVTQTLAASADRIIDGEGIGLFGGYIVSGDINGDGYADIAVSASEYNSIQGRAYIFYSTGNGGITQTAAAAADRRITGQSINDYFSTGIAIGDINNDGYSDLVIGASQYNAGLGLGRAYIFYSTGTGGITQNLAASADGIISGETAGDHFGNSFSTGDINGDGCPDLIASSFKYNAGSNQGRSYIFYSTGAGGILASVASSADRIITGEVGTGNFGWGSLISDINGDGYKDFITGAPNYNAGQGRTYIMHSAGASGISTTVASFADRIITGEAGTSQFGRWRY